MSQKRNVISIHKNVRVEELPATGQRSLHATKNFNVDEIIFPFGAAEEFLVPTYLTVQKDDALHITLSPSFLQYVNHACHPNAFFDTERMQFVALQAISKDEELTFFYPSTEWEMAQPFSCGCGCNNCLGTIQGAAFLADDILQAYRLTAYIERKLAQRRRASA